MSLTGASSSGAKEKNTNREGKREISPSLSFLLFLNRLKTKRTLIRNRFPLTMFSLLILSPARKLRLALQMMLVAWHSLWAVPPLAYFQNDFGTMWPKLLLPLVSHHHSWGLWNQKRTACAVQTREQAVLSESLLQRLRKLAPHVTKSWGYF